MRSVWKVTGKNKTLEMFYEKNEVCEHVWRLKVQRNQVGEDAQRLQKSGWVIQMLAKQTTSLSYLSSVQRQKQEIKQ